MKKIIIILVIVIIVETLFALIYCYVPKVESDYYRFRLVDGRELVAKAPAGSKIANPVRIGQSYYYWTSATCNNENHFCADYVNDIVVK